MDNLSDTESMNICPAYKMRYERRVIKSGNGLCAMCWERQERKEKYVRERERVLEEKIRERIGGKGRGMEKENGRMLGDIDEEVEEGLEERGENWKRERKEKGREENEENEYFLQETEKKTWILEGNGRVRKKLDGNEGKGVRNGWLG
ncbi:hypothetical protein BPOR_0041g00060 [Botrytis porri]|uniref:Uncharacterized protein n=2 Tax=Botrytis porri TaxID=87229 RepID=A0A4Z1L3A3_9HELO|nr:hypothetical protein BPOR_0041g00060 [Botrytis porri]